jgi:F-type H+-transporting ATPase subunit epsilon
MADTFELEIATPERLLVREQVSEAQIPAANGYLGILPGHSPLLAEMGIGDLTYTSDGRRRHIAISGGWVEVLRSHVRVLADTAENADEVDVKRAEDALKRARERLAHPGLGLDVGRALNALKRAQARLEASSRKQ